MAAADWARGARLGVRHRARRCRMSPADDRRDASGRQRGAARSQGRTQRSAAAPSQRRRGSDPARTAAYDVLRSVDGSDAYANLVLPPLLRERRITRPGRGVRHRARLRHAAAARPVRRDHRRWRPAARSSTIDAPALDVLRLGRPPAARHARARARGGVRDGRPRPRAAGHRTVAVRQRRAADGRAVLAATSGRSTIRASRGRRRARPALAVVESHPLWVVRALREALVGQRPVRRRDRRAARRRQRRAARDRSSRGPGLAGRRRGRWTTRATASRPSARWRRPRSSWRAATPQPCRACATGARGCRTRAASWSRSPSTQAPLDGPRRAVARPVRRARRQGRAARGRRGGARCADRGQRGAAAPHAARRAGAARGARGRGRGRADGRRADGRRPTSRARTTGSWSTRPAPVWVRCAVGRRRGGAGRRPTSPSLSALQRELLVSALQAVRPGGVVAYVTCSPHLVETQLVVKDAVRAAARLGVDVEPLDTPAVVRGDRARRRRGPRRQPDGRAAVAARARHGRDAPDAAAPHQLSRRPLGWPGACADQPEHPVRRLRQPRA